MIGKIITFGLGVYAGIKYAENKEAVNEYIGDKIDGAKKLLQSPPSDGGGSKDTA